LFSDYVRNDDLRIYAGDDRPIIWPILDRTGAPADPAALTGYTVRAQVRATPDSTVILHEWSTVNTRAAILGSTVSLYVDDSEAWTWTGGVYDLHLIDSQSRHEVLAWGRVTVLPGVTR
jgi:hypothetical protein